MKRINDKNKGFTLIELILVILLISILAEIGTYVLLTSFKANLTHQNLITANNQARMALERMTRDIHAINSPASILTATSTQFSFTDISGSNITYQLTNNKLMRNADVLADDVTTLAFVYFDKNAIATNVPANIRYINVNLLISVGTAQSSIRTTIYTMNFT